MIFVKVGRNNYPKIAKNCKRHVFGDMPCCFRNFCLLILIYVVDNNVFYPQYKFCLFWINFWQVKKCVNNMSRNDLKSGNFLKKHLDTAGITNGMHEELTMLVSHSSGVVKTSSCSFGSVGRIVLKDNNKCQSFC